jgi:ABC-type Mn2+/Zn2+ transport system permease subunit
MALATAAGLLGPFVVQRGLAFLADGLAHATLGGVALGLVFGASREAVPLVALPFAVLVALGIGAVRRRSGLSADVATGVFFTTSFALGVIGLELRGASSEVDLEELLFGSLLAVSHEGLLPVLVAALVTVAVLLRLWPKLAYATFDAELAAISGVRVALVEQVLMGLLALVVVAGIRSVGVVLVSAVVVLPAATAHLLARRLARIVVLSVSLAVGASMLGLFVSHYLKVAAGATIVVVMGAAFFAALATAPRRSS